MKWDRYGSRGWVNNNPHSVASGFLRVPVNTMLSWLVRPDLALGMESVILIFFFFIAGACH
jgi:hypothetical protein